MNPDRRELLATLGLGGAVGLAGCSLLEDESDPDDEAETTPQSDGGGGSAFDARARVEASLAERAPTRPEPDFSYDPVDAETPNSDLFDHVTARPAANAAGDYLQFRPGARSPADLASLLRDLTNVESESTIVATVEDRPVDLTGGDAPAAATFVGTASFDGAAVIAIRATDPGTARSLAERVPFPLSTE